MLDCHYNNLKNTRLVIPEMIFSKLGNFRVMPRKPVVGVVFGRLFTFLPPTSASQLRPIDNKPKPMSSPLDYPAYSFARCSITQPCYL